MIALTPESESDASHPRHIRKMCQTGKADTLTLIDTDIFTKTLHIFTFFINFKHFIFPFGIFLLILPSERIIHIINIYNLLAELNYCNIYA